AAHQKWWTDLEIPVLARVQIEHELDKSTLQPRPGAGKTNKSAATELRGALEIEQLKPGSDDNVIERICNFGFRSPLPHHQIRAWIPSDRSIRVWQVRNLEEEIAFFFISRGRLFAQRGDLITHLADTVFERSGIFTAASFSAYFFTQLFALGVERLQRGLCFPTFGVQPQQFIDLGL